MDSTNGGWQVRDKARLLRMTMDALVGNARISFEGSLRDLSLLSFPGAVSEETDVLKRNTTWPEQDFVVVLLEDSLGRTILSAIGGNVPKKIIHIQIEKAGVLEFAAYDNFQSIFFGSALDQQFLETLVLEGILNRVPVGIKQSN